MLGLFCFRFFLFHLILTITTVYSAGKVQSVDKYIPGTGMIWAAESWECQGTEDTVESCKNFPGVKSRCNHSQDVGVYCHDITTQITSTVTMTTQQSTTYENTSSSGLF